jgi:hypothetical protein
MGSKVVKIGDVQDPERREPAGGPSPLQRRRERSLPAQHNRCDSEVWCGLFSGDAISVVTATRLSSGRRRFPRYAREGRKRAVVVRHAKGLVDHRAGPAIVGGVPFTGVAGLLGNVLPAFATE